MILHELHRQMEALLRRSFRPQEVLTRNPSRSSTVLKRNHAVKQQVSLFWMEPALGDAVISSVRSESRPDSSHQKACLLEISHMTAGGAKAVLTRLLPLAVVLFVNGLVSLCRLRGSCCA